MPLTGRKNLGYKPKKASRGPQTADLSTKLDKILKAKKSTEDEDDQPLIESEIEIKEEKEPDLDKLELLILEKIKKELEEAESKKLKEREEKAKLKETEKLQKKKQRELEKQKEKQELEKFIRKTILETNIDNTKSTISNLRNTRRNQFNL